MSAFGRDFRRELFARTSSLAATRLGVVLLDEAYTQRSATLAAGYRYIREETGLDGRDLERARDELKDAGLLEVESEGAGVKARTRWTLLLPGTSGLDRTFGDDEAAQNDRSTPDDLDRSNVRSNDRLNVRSNDRSTPGTFLDPDPVPTCAGCAGALDEDGFCFECNLVTPPQRRAAIA